MRVAGLELNHNGSEQMVSEANRLRGRERVAGDRKLMSRSSAVEEEASLASQPLLGTLAHSVPQAKPVALPCRSTSAPNEASRVAA
jgi:hypothetical protein